MDKNFRSTKNIIKISNKIIQGNKIRYEKSSKHTTEENSQIMLFDEPFSALDAMTKVQLQEELLKIHQEKGKTVILVTHDIEEAVYLGDRVVVMAANPGVIKDIINIDIEGRKDRTNTEFLSYKNKIYDYFFEDRNKNAVEYNI